MFLLSKDLWTSARVWGKGRGGIGCRRDKSNPHLLVWGEGGAGVKKRREHHLALGRGRGAVDRVCEVRGSGKKLQEDMLA